MFAMFIPSNHFWLADDAQVYASAREVVTTDADPEYAAWIAEGNVPNPWPRDEAGNQTEASMQDVVGPYGQFVNLQYYTAFKRWQKEQGGLTLTSGMPILTDDRSQAKINGARLFATNNSTFTTQWHAADGNFYPLAAADVISMSDQLQTHIDNCFAISSQTMAGIADGSITTRDQIDAAFA
jgi:Domain of unknown function (DUF4376)